MTDIVTKVLVVLLAISVAMGAKFFLHMKDDNMIEQSAEEVIKGQTGYIIDLSPEMVKEID